MSAPHCATCRCEANSARDEREDSIKTWQMLSERLPGPIGELARSVVTNKHRVKNDYARRVES